MTVASAFFSQEWAQDVHAALNAGPDDAALAGKLTHYWDVYDVVRAQYSASWALGVRNLPAELGGGERYLYIAWAGYFVRECRVLGASEPVTATYVLMAEYADWKALCGGYDVLRTLIDRRITLERGELLEFFAAIHFFAESLAMIAKVPVEL